ncbi:hypothetical protein AVEN_93540-1 [Araneus ventricosus]|uniref:Uncharacterized protein n=1 Tax=Araneus ventricosus TaxID=182803 RepID=A0A4Y2APE0_ARAVE|nr:hypothetical protein AVEN_93540-1 [Araneus ventricosus]
MLRNVSAKKVSPRVDRSVTECRGRLIHRFVGTYLISGNMFRNVKRRSIQRDEAIIISELRAKTLVVGVKLQKFEKKVQSLPYIGTGLSGASNRAPLRVDQKLL